MDLNNKNVESPNSKNLTSLNNDFSDIIFNPIIIIIVFVIIVLIFSFSSSLGNNKDDFVFGETSNSNGSTLLAIIIGIVIIYVLIKIIEFIYDIDVSTKFYDFNTDKAKIELNFNDDKISNL
jgi:heme/copper-type cytochrome/quinol oxidase subunit 2